MNTKGFVPVVLLIVIAAVVIAGIGGYFALKQKTATPTPDTTSGTVTSSNETPPASSSSSSSAFASSTVYENTYMKVVIPSGWTAKQATKTVYYGSCRGFKTDCTTTPKVEPNPAAVNITKGKYILYINTQGGQASGIEGGRFYEIAGGAPSVAAVMQDPSSGVDCSTSQDTTAVAAASSDYLRKDLYESGAGSNDYRAYCSLPNTGTVWYFSYITTQNGGYFNYYGGRGSGPIGLVITMAYNSTEVNALPIKGSADLNAMLTAMTSIVQSLEVKHP